MGRKRKPEEEKSTTVFVRLPNPVLWKLQERGDPEKIIRKLIDEFLKK